MIPEKGKVYEIDYIPGIIDENLEWKFKGKAECLDDEPERDGLYWFKILDGKGGNAMFAEEDIIKEA